MTLLFSRRELEALRDAAITLGNQEDVDYWSRQLLLCPSDEPRQIKRVPSGPMVQLVKHPPMELVVFRFSWTTADGEFAHLVPAYDLAGADALFQAERGPFPQTQTFIVSHAVRMRFEPIDKDQTS